ncbi:hypothetical protein RBH29_00825 [Herbivorax sp. ANBcel31]|uniref:hypothetical protein n=1 Tax=Herbivorax sp. ANBcel31 TaxID=3069754 RepID=UPI0027B520E2|nr:hypothetical protein [Herbivorax sp. ANBcel31]MDQ2084980.1 hypothetical protein [Herbivorax sp. ANBcel31]
MDNKSFSSLVIKLLILIIVISGIYFITDNISFERNTQISDDKIYGLWRNHPNEKWSLRIQEEFRGFSFVCNRRIFNKGDYKDGELLLRTVENEWYRIEQEVEGERDKLFLILLDENYNDNDNNEGLLFIRDEED